MSKKQSGRGKIVSGIFFSSLAAMMVSVAFAADNRMNATSMVQREVNQQLQLSPTQGAAMGQGAHTGAPSSMTNSATMSDVPIPPVQTLDSLQDNSTADQLFPAPGVQEKAAFKSMTAATMPMSPGQVIRLHRMLNLMQKAVAASPLTPPVPVITTRVVSLSPGVTPPVIRLGQGFVTSVLFIDSTGQPWPITAYDIGNPKAFNIQPPQKEGNMMMLQAMQPYTYGNMAVTLKGMKTPVMITLVPGQKMVDYRVDLHIAGMGPKATKVVGSNTLAAPANDILLDVLNGMSPKGAKVLNVSGVGKSNLAWLVAGKLYLRTKLTIISPAWIAMMRSADGTKAYEMQQTPSILVSRGGRLINLEIEGL